MNEISPVEMEIIQLIRELRPFERIEVRLKDNVPGEVIVTIKGNKRIEYAI